jgi:hypothetical protein
MKITLIGFISATALAWAIAATPALATVLPAGATTWDFYTLLNSQGYNGESTGNTADIFNQGGQSLFVESVSQAGSAASNGNCLANWCGSSLDLYAKNGGTPSEQGLGLSGDPYGNGGEIYYPNGILVTTEADPGDVSGFTMGSVQGTATSGENWAVLGFNYTTGNWDTLGSGSGGDIVNFDSSALAHYNLFIISQPSPDLVNGSNDIVLMSMTTVPEPGTLTLLAVGLAAMGLAVSRRRKIRAQT